MLFIYFKLIKIMSLILNNIYQFNNIHLFYKAITHKAFMNEEQQRKIETHGCFEEIEILGQSLMEFIFLDYMHENNFPRKGTDFDTYGKLIKLRKKIFEDQPLSSVAIQLELDQKLRVGGNQSLKQHPKTLSSAFKSLIAAQYLDKNRDTEHCKEVLKPIFYMLLEQEQELIKEMSSNIRKVTFKGQLYMMMQADPNIQPLVQMQMIPQSKQRPQAEFIYKIQVNGKVFEQRGSIKKKVEEKAYEDVFYYLNSLDPTFNSFDLSQTQRIPERPQQIDSFILLNDRSFIDQGFNQIEQPQQQKQKQEMEFQMNNNNLNVNQKQKTQIVEKQSIDKLLDPNQKPQKISDGNPKSEQPIKNSTNKPPLPQQQVQDQSLPSIDISVIKSQMSLLDSLIESSLQN